MTQRLPFFASAVFFFVCFSGVSCLVWTGPLRTDSMIVPACVTRNVSLVWDFNLEGRERVRDITWTVQRTGSPPEMIAVHREGEFLPVDPFVERVQFRPKAGLVLSDVTMADSGVYSVEVDVHDDVTSRFTEHKTSIQLEVGDFFKVTQDSMALYVNLTDTWHVQLKCGLFSTLRDPSGVIWTTPSGREVSSTSYKDGYLYLQLPNPVEGGQYTCRLPELPSNQACLLDNATDIAREPNVTVDEVKGRLTLLEAENRQLKSMVEKRENPGRPVAFHAYLSSGTSIWRNSRVKPDTVVTNDDGAYDARTGEFTAPYTGLYFFSATSATNVDSYDLELQVNGTTVCWTASKGVGVYGGLSNEMGACQATARLAQGQKAWLARSSAGGQSTITFAGQLTSFTGYLIAADD